MLYCHALGCHVVLLLKVPTITAHCLRQLRGIVFLLHGVIIFHVPSMT